MSLTENRDFDHDRMEDAIDDMLTELDEGTTTRRNVRDSLLEVMTALSIGNLQEVLTFQNDWIGRASRREAAGSDR